MRSPSILVVDDEAPLAELVRGYLAAEAWDVTVVSDGLAAVDAARDVAPDVIVLDVMLPEIDGLEALRRIRVFSDAYVIMLTARTDEIDRVLGLTLGADDYLTKPFSPRELVARIKTLLRRPRSTDRSSEDGRIVVDELVVDEPARLTFVEGQPVDLTALEFDLLLALLTDRGVVFTRQRLLDRLWGMDYVGDQHVVDVHIANLRSKLGDDAVKARYIETVRGVGYRFRPAASER
ncbi:MAG: response regulator transcription factor [Chloroflexota bacterium]